MKILTVNISDGQGGAARASYRLHKALLKEGIDSQMLVQHKSNDDYTILGPRTNIEKGIASMGYVLDALPLRLYKNKMKTTFSSSWFSFSGVVDRINRINPDIVHLHWICGSMIKIENLTKINAPIVWTLHDNWLFTGGCHIMWECEKYKADCGACVKLGSQKEYDLSRKIFNRKKRTFSKIENMTIVGVSQWITDCSKSSTLLQERKHITLPNLIDTSIYKPFSKNHARELWNLPKDKKLVLFGANSAISDRNKGFKELSEALYKFKYEDVELVVFGSSTPKESQSFGFKTHYLGYFHDDVSLITLYSSVDVVVIPSLQESFGQIASESMACGIPVVAFGHTGLLDIVEHKSNGYLAKPFDSSDLANGIEWILNYENYDELCKNAREKILKEFESEVVVKRYIKLYKGILNA